MGFICMADLGTQIIKIFYSDDFFMRIFEEPKANGNEIRFETNK